MRTVIQIFLLLTLVAACATATKKNEVTNTKPKAFLGELIPENMMAHAGVFSLDQKDYYFTLSDVEFSTFTVMHSQKNGDQWTTPDTAFFNSAYFEHGVHFSPDGQWLYFSSTRPSGIDSIADTWHIWRSKKTGTLWNTPTYVEIPGFSQRLISHPSTTNEGRLYFHAGNTDYSELTLYYADQKNENFLSPVKVSFPADMNQNSFTPFVSPDESYLLFAKSVDHREFLYISNQQNGSWGPVTKLSNEINANNLGNPYVTPDGKYLYYASGEISAYGLPFNWVIKKVSTSNMLPK